MHKSCALNFLMSTKPRFYYINSCAFYKCFVTQLPSSLFIHYYQALHTNQSLTIFLHHHNHMAKMPITIPSQGHSPTRTNTLVIAPPRALSNAEWPLSTRVQHLHLLRFTLATFPPPSPIIYNHLDYSTPHRHSHLTPPRIKYSLRGWNPFLHLLGTPLTIHT